MNTDFKYFFWGVPQDKKCLYAVYDFYDNHFFLLSDDYQKLYRLIRLFDSKCTLDIVEIEVDSAWSGDNLIDNSVAMQWGLKEDIRPDYFYNDVHFYKKRFNSEQYYNRWVLKNQTLVNHSKQLDSYKQDLQEQIFFFYHCLSFVTKENATVLVEKLKHAIGCGKDYEHAKDLLVNFNNFDRASRQTLMDFLRTAELFYE
jgi:hypothetical protein